MNRKEWEAQIYASNLNTTARLVALVVGSFGNWTDDRAVWPSVTAVADMTGLTRGTAAKYVDALVEQGWLKHTRTREKNVKEYELCKSVVEPFGILAKQNRSLSDKQLSNLSTTELSRVSATDSEPVVETNEGSCRNDAEQLSKREGAVVEPFDTNLKEPKDMNLKEPMTTVPDGPVDEENEVLGSTEEKNYFHRLPPTAKTELISVCRFYNLNPRVMERAAKTLVLSNYRGHSPDEIENVLEKEGVTVTRW